MFSTLVVAAGEEHDRTCVTRSVDGAHTDDGRRSLGVLLECHRTGSCPAVSRTASNEISLTGSRPTSWRGFRPSAEEREEDGEQEEAP